MQRPTRLTLAACMLLGVASCSDGSAPVGGGETYGPVNVNLNTGPIPQHLVPHFQKASGRYCPEITSAALAGQQYQESRFNLKALNATSLAAGPAQFVPKTWSQYGRDVNGNGQNSPYDPADATDAQARYMCDLVKMMRPRVKSGQLRGDVLDLAWAGYNAGQGKVFAAGGIPDITETKDYVRILRANLSKFSTSADAPAVVADGKFVNPLEGQKYSLSSGFGPRRSPCTGCSTMHAGQDMAIPSGAPVRAACSGRAIAARSGMAGMGTAVVLDCGKGIRTYYGHLTRPTIAQGASVTAGQLIGVSGNTGNSSGPHLHFEVHTNSPAQGSVWAGQAINPVPFMTKNGAAL